MSTATCEVLLSCIIVCLVILELSQQELRQIYPGMNAFRTVWEAVRGRIVSFSELFCNLYVTRFNVL